MSHVRADLNATAPGTPPAGTSIIYPKSDGKWYRKDTAGVETELGAGAGKPFLPMTPQAFVPSLTNGAFQSIRNGHPILVFIGTTFNAECSASSFLSPSYAGGGLVVTLYLSFAAVSGTATFQAGFERVQLGVLDIDADSFAAFKSVSMIPSATSGIVTATSITFADGAEIDGLLAGEPFRLKIRRMQDGTVGTDDITTNAELWGVTLREA